MEIGDKVSDGNLSAIITKINPLTFWVRLLDGNEIKRHKKKHSRSAKKVQLRSTNGTGSS